MAATNNVRRITVRALILNDAGQLLCVRQKHSTNGAVLVADNWCLPGGKLEAGEALQAGLRREMVEETGVAPSIGNLLYIQQFTHENAEGRVESLEFFFQVTNFTDYQMVDLSQTSHGEAEIAEVAFVEPATTSILPHFLTTEPLATQAQQGVTKIISFPDEPL